MVKSKSKKQSVKANIRANIRAKVKKSKSKINFKTNLQHKQNLQRKTSHVKRSQQRFASLQKPLITADQIAENSIVRIKRLEDIHRMQSYVHRGSDIIAFWAFLLTVLIGNFFASVLILFLIIFLKSVFLLFVIFTLGLSLGFIYEKYLNGMHHLFLHHHLFSKVFLLFTGAVNVFYMLSTSAYISNVFGIGFDSGYIILATSIYFISYLIPYAYVKLFHHHR